MPILITLLNTREMEKYSGVIPIIKAREMEDTEKIEVVAKAIDGKMGENCRSCKQIFAAPTQKGLTKLVCFQNEQPCIHFKRCIRIFRNTTLFFSEELFKKARTGVKISVQENCQPLFGINFPECEKFACTTGLNQPKLNVASELPDLP